MRIRESKLRRIIRKVIVESMSPSHPDYEMVGQAIHQALMGVMMRRQDVDTAVTTACTDLGMMEHYDYIYSKVQAQLGNM